MPTYISLINFTQKGAEAIKDGPKRLEAAKQRFRDSGAELKAFYLVTGQYDAVSIVEAPNDEVVAIALWCPQASSRRGKTTQEKRGQRSEKEVGEELSRSGAG